MAALDAIPNLKGKCHFLDNELGKRNPGSGMVVAWSRMLPDLLGRYEYLVHYEPRQHLVNYSFFERMANRPDAYFCRYGDKIRLYGMALTIHRFWTGFFSMRTADLWGYCRAKDRCVPPRIVPNGLWWWRWRRLKLRLLPDWLAYLDEAIESDFPRFVRRHRIPIVRVPDLGSLWHQGSKDRMVKMIECDFRDDEVVV
jgi:hypothetical protein